MYESLLKEIRKLQEKDKALEEKNKKFEEEIEKLKKENASDLEGIKNKLSNYAQHAVENSKGPLKPEELFKFFVSDAFGKCNKETLNFIRKYSNNSDEVRKQLSQILETLEIHMAYMKKQKELDDKFAKTLKSLEKTIRREEDKENKSSTKLKIKSTLAQDFDGRNVSCKVTHEFNCNNDPNSSKQEVFEESDTSKQENFPKEGGKSSRKRKCKADDDSPSRKENGVKQITSRLSKRLKVNSSSNTPESSIEFMSVGSSQSSQSSTEPMSVGSSQSSQSSSEPMSVESSQSSQSSTESMSVGSSQSSESNTGKMPISEKSQPDAISTDDLREKIKKARKSSKPLEPKYKDAPGCSGKVKTILERHFYLRGKPQ